ncbi:MAG: heme-binding protein [Verrucomicrobiales bacterium]|nr:heme-binding protein [Verrucomicrobiales bacterium]
MNRLIICLFAISSATTTIAAPAKLKALLVAGGCCHDYANQHKVLSDGIQKLANVQVDVWWTDDKSVNPPLDIYNDPNWAKGYDVVIHDECAAGNRDLVMFKRILDAHKTIPSVHLHCAMHSFRNGTDQWFKHLGLQSTRHGPHVPVEIKFTKPHPITEGMKGWTTGREELYNHVKTWDIDSLATGRQVYKRGEKEFDETYTIVWTHEMNGVRSFSTTLGHYTETVSDPRYLNLVTRGLLWSCDQLNDSVLGKPFTGKNKITFVKGKPKQAAKPKPTPTIAKAPPKNATLVTPTASTVQNGRYPWMAIDGQVDTRWCASSSKKPEWFQIEFDKPTEVDGVSIVWEKRDDWYQYTVEISNDGKKWEIVADKSKNTTGGDTNDKFKRRKIKFLRVTVLKQQRGLWCSFWELKVSGPKIKSIFPKIDKQTAARLREADKYKNGGNITPKIVKLSEAEEAEILKDVKVPAGFEATLFAPWQTANYPVYVCAAPDGTLYVSSDGNGSLGRNPNRGRILRLRDLDGDGRADEVKEFVKNIDSPRGIIWDHDRLYVLHPPHISVYFDRDGDGIAEGAKRLISGVAFGFDKRPPDHTTNGLELGADGWIYIAGGDFGFMEAVGTDGRRLQHRAGGVIRFRPDGTGLEIFATGTRNILGTPMSPLLDLFARDNTNDGGGWDVRFHHFSGLEDHGYPRMYKNFPDEHIHPLADYGGGSGCGSVYIHEPGFPKGWAHAPFTCDWGRAGLFRHSVKRKGAGFVETEAPKTFIKVTRPTDADVDGMSRVFQASWKGPATFNWAGPDHGYITRVTPKDFKPEPLPNFEKLKDAQLVKLLESPSHIRSLTAQRTLLRRDANESTTKSLLKLAGNESKELRARVMALYAISQRGVDSSASEQVLKTISPLTKSPSLQPFVLRALGDMGINLITAGKQGLAPAEHLIDGAKSEDPHTRVEAIIAAARQNNREVAPAIAQSLGHQDPVIAHTAFQALAKLVTPGPCLDILDTASSTDAQRQGAAHALMRMHYKDVIEALTKRLESAPKQSKPNILSALCRLYHKEAEWTGDSWGTRPDTRGPYYQLSTWEQSENILAALKSALAKASPSEAAQLIKEMNRNRIRDNDALNRIVELANEDESHIVTAVAQLASVGDIPSGAIPLLHKAARKKDTPPMAMAQTVECLMKLNDGAALESTLAALSILDDAKGENKAQQAAKTAFLKNRKLENHRDTIAKLAANAEFPNTRWAHAGLLELASSKKTSKEAQSLARKEIDLAWQNPIRRITLIKLAAELKNHFLDARIAASLTDFNPDIVNAAKNAVRRLRIQPPGADKTPKIATLKPAEALTQAIQLKGDPALGEAVFIKAACATCHTTSQDQPQKGPYLGNIANTYRRKDLAESILEPNKTIAQGFSTHILTLKNDTTMMGFITKEAAEEVKLRDVAAQEHTVKKSDIAKRATMTTSIMPPGLMGAFSVKEFASLLDYLEALSKN